MEKERIINIERWDFADSLDDDRKENLKAAPSFYEITAQIKKEIKVLCFHPDPCQDDKQFERFVYSIFVGKKLFDWFYNSVNGYRAAYYQSPHEGIKANEYFIQSLMPDLIASDKTAEDADKGFIKETLKSPSAKAWLVEHKGFKNWNGEDCQFCEEWTLPRDKEAEILNSRWENETCQNAEWGRKAPYLTKIRIMGAFLNDHYDEFIPSTKRFRAKDINENGWS